MQLKSLEVSNQKDKEAKRDEYSKNMLEAAAKYQTLQEQ